MLDEQKLLENRTKELDTLLKISEIKDLNVKTLLRKAIKIIPQGMLFPEESQARIIYGNTIYCSCGKENCEHKPYVNMVESETKNGNPLKVLIGYINEKEIIPKHEQTLVNGITRILKDKLDYIKSEEEKKRFAKTKESEVYHRMKNNLGVTAAIVRLQMNNYREIIENEKCSDNSKKEILKYHEKTESELVAKINTMANLNKVLYRFKREDDGSLNLDEYIQMIIQDIKTNYSEISENVHLEEKISSGIFLGIEGGIPCGLIVNELLSNVYKYTKEGSAEITLEKLNNQIRISVYNSTQFPYESIEEAQKQSFGLNLVGDLLNQINAKLTLDKTEGTRFILEIPCKQ